MSQGFRGACATVLMMLRLTSRDFACSASMHLCVERPLALCSVAWGAVMSCRGCWRSIRTYLEQQELKFGAPSLQSTRCRRMLWIDGRQCSSWMFVPLSCCGLKSLLENHDVTSPGACALDKGRGCLMLRLWFCMAWPMCCWFGRLKFSVDGNATAFL